MIADIVTYFKKICQGQNNDEKFIIYFLTYIILTPTTTLENLNLEPDWCASQMLAYQNIGKPINFDTHLVKGNKKQPT